MKIDYEQTASLIRSMFAAYGFTDEEIANELNVPCYL